MRKHVAWYVKGLPARARFGAAANRIAVRGGCRALLARVPGASSRRGAAERPRRRPRPAALAAEPVGPRRRRGSAERRRSRRVRRSRAADRRLGAPRAIRECRVERARRSPRSTTTRAAPHRRPRGRVRAGKSRGAGRWRSRGASRARAGRVLVTRADAGEPAALAAAFPRRRSGHESARDAVRIGRAPRPRGRVCVIVAPAPPTCRSPRRRSRRSTRSAAASTASPTSASPACTACCAEPRCGARTRRRRGRGHGGRAAERGGRARSTAR